MSKLQNIINGWANLLWRDPEVEKVALERSKICAECNNLNDMNVCVACNCFVPAKVRSLNEHCKLGEW